MLHSNFLFFWVFFFSFFGALQLCITFLIFKILFGFQFSLTYTTSLIVTVLVWNELGNCRNFPLSKSLFYVVDHSVETNEVCCTPPIENHICYPSLWLYSSPHSKVVWHLQISSWSSYHKLAGACLLASAQENADTLFWTGTEPIW